MVFSLLPSRKELLLCSHPSTIYFSSCKSLTIYKIGIYVLVLCPLLDLNLFKGEIHVQINFISQHLIHCFVQRRSLEVT